MKFIKGVMIGGIVTTGLVMMYSESTGMMNKKKLMKKEDKWLKKWGLCREKIEYRKVCVSSENSKLRKFSQLAVFMIRIF